MIAALIVVGGGAGAVIRWLTTVWLGTSAKGFPVGTTVVNVVGSLALGVLVGLDTSIAGVDTQPVTVGVLGGFTTFSTWMVQIAGEPVRRQTYVIVAVPTILGLVAAVVGIAFGRLLAG